MCVTVIVMTTHGRHQLNIRIPVELLDAVKTEARLSGTNTTTYAITALTNQIASDQEKRRQIDVARIEAEAETRAQQIIATIYEEGTHQL